MQGKGEVGKRRVNEVNFAEREKKTELEEREGEGREKSLLA